MVEPHLHSDGSQAQATPGATPPPLSWGDPHRQRASSRHSALRAIALILLVGAAGAVLLFWPRDVAPPPAPTVAPAPATPTAAAPVIRYPLEAASPNAEQTPLPSLQESDTMVLDALAGLVGGNALELLMQRDGIIQRIVATVDNLPRQTLAPRLLPVRPVPGPFATVGSGDAMVIAGDNAARYAPYLRVVDAIDAKTLAALYVRLYPLFQQAYRDLGYPNGYFNDRLIEAIDDLLAAPIVQAPIRLAQPKVLYEFADPALERRSAGQKLLMRMGNNNAARVKAKLAQFRREVVGPNAKP